MEQILSLWASSGLAQISGGQLIMILVGFVCGLVLFFWF
jgi:hypothetical protein